MIAFTILINHVIIKINILDISSSLIGKGHLSSRKVFCEGQIFNSLKEASNFYNISRETIRQRCKSNNKNWKEFYIIEE